MLMHRTEADLTVPTNAIALTVLDVEPITGWREHLATPTRSWPHLRLHNNRTGKTLLYRVQDVTTHNLLTAYERGWTVYLCHQAQQHLGRNAQVVVDSALLLVPTERVSHYAALLDDGASLRVDRELLLSSLSR